MNDIYKTFNIPEEFPIGLLATRLSRALFYLSEIAVCAESERDHFKELQCELARMRTPPQPAQTRAELHNYLKNCPFMTTLLLLGEPDESPYCDDITNRKIALLAHLFECRGAVDYKAYLTFSKCVIDQQLSILTLGCLLDLTSLEIHLLIKKSVNRENKLEQLAPFFIPLKTRIAEHKPSVLSAKNRHVQVIESTSDSELLALDNTNELAERCDEYLLLDSRVALTTVQQRRQFQRRLFGAQRAYYAHESAVAGGMHAALPCEINELLQQAAPWLLSADMSLLQLNDAQHLLMLFLSMLGLSSQDIVLYNKGSTKKLPVKECSVYLDYEFPKRSRFIIATLELRSDLLKTAIPKTQDPRIHFVCKGTLHIPVPYPITHLLNAVLRSIPPYKRQVNTLYDAIKFDSKQYVFWLNAALKSCRLYEKGITKGAIEKAFIQFSRESVPETYLRLLSRKPCIQNHYISVPTTTLTNTVLQAWRTFCIAAGMTWKNANAHEAGDKSVSHQPHTELGSKITLRPEIYRAVYQCLLSTLSDRLEFNSINRLSLYLYLRLASTVGLRPTKSPLPTIDHVNFGRGIFTVADKRVHSKDELRLIVLPSKLTELITLWRVCAKQYAMSINAGEPSHLLMWWDNGWRSFDRKLVNEQLQRITKEPLINHSLRHTAAQRYIQNSPDFNQSLLDMLLNHSRAGVSLFNQYAAISPAHLIKLQQLILDDVDREFTHFDTSAHTHLTQLAGEKNAAVN